MDARLVCPSCKDGGGDGHVDLLNAALQHQEIDRERLRTGKAPMRCLECKLVNWPEHLDGTPRTSCHKCGSGSLVSVFDLTS